ncbi:MAG: 50S ribosomal protein L23 [Patescibacteria group bacterium]
MGIFSKKKPKDEAVKQEDAVAQPHTSIPKGGDPSSYRVIVGPHVTEKATAGAAQGAYVFKVHKDANKTSIKYAIEKLYKVRVKKVHVLHVPSKERHVGRYVGVKSGYKKAIVTLHAGNTIDITG